MDQYKNIDRYSLNKYSYSELKQMACDMGLVVHRKKDQLIADITEAFIEYETYKRKKFDKYTFIKNFDSIKNTDTNNPDKYMLYIVSKGGTEYTMKKVVSTIQRDCHMLLHKEVDFQKRAADNGISLNIVSIDTVLKYIIMDKIDTRLIDVIHKQQVDINKQRKYLTKKQQKQIVSIHKKLDKAKIYHSNPDLSNYVYKDDVLYIINFDTAKEITPVLVQKLNTSTPNTHLMTMELVLAMQRMNYDSSSYEYMVKYLPDTNEYN